MSIQWYPGHMHKASKQIKELLPIVDLVIEVLDARIPYSSENPMIEKLRGAKPCIKLLTKSDLADPTITAQWLQHLELSGNIKAMAVSTTQPAKIRQLTELCRVMLPSAAKKPKPLHVMIMGIPNVGKSTLINILAGKSIAKTGNEPAVTKGQQRINLDNGIILSDTPGMLWPKIENASSGYRLAATGAIKDTAISNDDVAFFAADFLLKHYPQQLRTRYQLDTLPDSELALLESIGKFRGCLGARGRVDLEKVSKIVLTELRSGALGRISLETPAMAAAEKIAVAVLMAETAAKKMAIKEARKSAAKSRLKK